MKDKKLLPILIAILVVFGLVSLMPPTFATPCPATEMCNWHYSGAVADEPGCDYAATHDLDAATAAALGDFLTAHVLAPFSGVEANVGPGLFAPNMSGIANVTMNPTGLPPCTDCTYRVMDTHDADGNMVLVSVYSDHSDLASLPGWYWCASYDNYAPSGMPDFDQTQQDDWRNPDVQRFSFCGPTAVANCFWWLDSKYADPEGVPGDGTDTFPLVRDYGGAVYPLPGPNWDDHNYSNVNDLATPWPPEGPPPATTAFVPGPQAQPSDVPAWGELVERLAWYVDTDGIRSGANFGGTLGRPMVFGIEQWLEEEGLDHMLGVTSVSEPDFYHIAEAAKRGDCVMLAVGWWDEEEPGEWRRRGGHVVTVAGVNTDELLIAFSDPGFDQAPPDNLQDHNDAAIVSHDIWRVDLDSPKSDGKWWLTDYAREFYSSLGRDDITYIAIADRATIISSIPPSVTAQAASSIGTDSACVNMTYTLGDQSTVDIRFAYRTVGDADWTETSWVAFSTPWVFLPGEGIHEETLVGLSSNTAYEFRGELRYDEIVIEGDVLTFTTKKIDPIVTTQEATDISTDSATLNMSFAVGDYSPVEVLFKWRESGTDPWSQTAWTPQELDGIHSEVLSGLVAETVYEFKAQLTYDYPPLVIEGDVSTLTTRAKGRCFIATAAYGTPMAEEVQILRKFRDGYLLNNQFGRAFVDLYYKVSPPIAEFITEHSTLKPIVRVGLMPAVAMSTVVVSISPAEKMAIVGLLVLLSVAMAVLANRRRPRAPNYG